MFSWLVDMAGHMRMAGHADGWWIWLVDMLMASGYGWWIRSWLVLMVPAISTIHQHMSSHIH
jgi:hypothetical protein